MWNKMHVDGGVSVRTRVRQLIGLRKTVEAILTVKEAPGQVGDRQVSDNSVETSKSGS